jgi:hypothetical protein
VGKRYVLGMLDSFRRRLCAGYFTMLWRSCGTRAHTQ